MDTRLELGIYAKQAATKNRLSTKMVLKTAPPNTHQWGSWDWRGNTPTPNRVIANTTAQLIPHGVPARAIAF